jgi:hypothetical protein
MRPAAVADDQCADDPIGRNVVRHNVDLLERPKSRN